MEIFAILLAIPASLVAAFIYSHVLMWAEELFPSIRVIFRPVSWLVLFLVAAELVIVNTAQVNSVRSQIGREYDLIQIALFVLGTPALANVLLLRPVPVSKWIVVPACGAITLVLVSLQYVVHEQLCGVDMICCYTEFGNDLPIPSK